MTEKSINYGIYLYIPYHSLMERRYPYYRIYVKNYVIWYVVIDDGSSKIMEIRRLLYNKQDMETLL